MIPTIRTISKTGRETIDLLSYDFCTNRKIMLCGPINDETATETIAQLEYLDQNGTDDIKLYINSAGGSVSSGMAIVDAMNRCKCDVATICTGMAASMGAFILSCGTKGKRYATPLSEVMIHQPLGGVQGQASDIQLVAEHIAKTKRRINEILAQNTGQSIETIAKDCDRDYFLTAQEAVQYGLVDKLLMSNKPFE